MIESPPFRVIADCWIAQPIVLERTPFSRNFEPKIGPEHAPSQVTPAQVLAPSAAWA